MDPQTLDLVPWATTVIGVPLAGVIGWYLRHRREERADARADAQELREASRLAVAHHTAALDASERERASLARQYEREQAQHSEEAAELRRELSEAAKIASQVTSPAAVRMRLMNMRVAVAALIQGDAAHTSIEALQAELDTRIDAAWLGVGGRLGANAETVAIWRASPKTIPREHLGSLLGLLELEGACLRIFVGALRLARLNYFPAFVVRRSMHLPQTELAEFRHVAALLGELMGTQDAQVYVDRAAQLIANAEAEPAADP